MRALTFSAFIEFSATTVTYLIERGGIIRHIHLAINRNNSSSSGEGVCAIRLNPTRFSLAVGNLPFDGVLATLQWSFGSGNPNQLLFRDVDIVIPDRSRITSSNEFTIGTVASVVIVWTLWIEDVSPAETPEEDDPGPRGRIRRDPRSLLLESARAILTPGPDVPRRQRLKKPAH